MKHIEYMHGDENLECSSDSFESIDVSNSTDSVLVIEYTGYSKNRRRL